MIIRIGMRAFLFAGILTRILTGVFAGISARIFAGILTGIFTGVFARILAGIFAGIFTRIFYAGISTVVRKRRQAAGNNAERNQ